MQIEILMPALSPTMKEGALNKWFVKVGDKIKAGDILAEIETDKATMEVEAVDEGTIEKILIKEGVSGVKVNSPIALLKSESDNSKSKNIKVKEKEYESSEKKNKPSEEIKNKEVKTHNLIKREKLFNNILASPYVIKIAKEKNIDLKNIEGSGPEGRIIKRDLENIEIEKNSFSTSASIKKTTEASSIRKIIAEKTSNTIKTVPHFYLKIESNVDMLIKLRNKINDNNENDKISINDILVKALAIAQYKNPDTNVSWLNGNIIKYSTVDVSIAVALKEGLIMPIIKSANKKGLLEISKETKNLVNKAKEGKLLPEEYNGGTISISNLGMFGISEFSAIINPPQSCILAVGAIKKLPRIIGNDTIHVNILNSTLSADHRVIDGAVGAKLLKDFSDIIENPLEIWLHSKDMQII